MAYIKIYIGVKIWQSCAKIQSRPVGLMWLLSWLWFLGTCFQSLQLENLYLEYMYLILNM